MFSQWILWITQERLLCRGSTNDSLWNTSEGSLFNKVESLTVWMHLTVLESTAIVCVNFVKFLGKLFCRAPPSNHFSHDVVVFLFTDQRNFQPKINLFGEAMVIWRRNSQVLSTLCSYGNNQVETSLSSCSHTCTDLGIGSGRKRRSEKFVKVG